MERRFNLGKPDVLSGVCFRVRSSSSSPRLKDAHVYSTQGLHLPHLNTFVVPNAANIAVFGSSQEGDQPLCELLGQQAYNNVCGLSVRRFLAPRNRTVPCLRNRTSLKL